MKFLVHPRKPSKRAHIWNGQHTLCFAYANGVISRSSDFVVVDHFGSAALCKTCENAMKKRR